MREKVVEMCEEVVEADFTGTQEAAQEAAVASEKKIESPGLYEFEDRLFKWVAETIKEYEVFPLLHLVESLSTVSLAYLISNVDVDYQRKYLEWVHKASMIEVDRVEKLKAEANNKPV